MVYPYTLYYTYNAARTGRGSDGKSARLLQVRTAGRPGIRRNTLPKYYTVRTVATGAGRARLCRRVYTQMRVLIQCERRIADSKIIDKIAVRCASGEDLSKYNEPPLNALDTSDCVTICQERCTVHAEECALAWVSAGTVERGRRVQLTTGYNSLPVRSISRFRLQSSW